MKKYLFTIAAVAAALVSCNKMEMEISAPKGARITISASSEATKTALGTDGKALIWSAGDKATVYAAGSSNYVSTFTLSAGEGTSNGSFIGTLSAETDTLKYLVYPGLSSNNYNNNSDTKAEYPLCLSVPSAQEAAAGQIPQMASLAVGNFTGTNASLKSAVSLLKFTLSGSTVNQIEIIDGGKTGLAGVLYAKLDESGNLVTKCDPSTNYPNLKVGCPIVLKASGEALSAGVYYAVVWPGSYNGLIFTFTDKDGKVIEKTASNALTFEAGHIYDIKTIDTGLEFQQNNTIVINIDGRPAEYLYEYSNTKANGWNLTSPERPTSSSEALPVTSFTCGGYEFPFNSAGSITISSSNRGITMGTFAAGDYIVLPAVDSAALKEVNIITTSSSGSTRQSVSIADKDGNIISAAKANASGLNIRKVEGKLGETSRLILNNAANFQFTRIQLVYEKPAAQTEGEVKKEYVFCDGTDKFQLFSSNIGTAASQTNYTQTVATRFNVTDKNDANLKFSFFATGGWLLHYNQGFKTGNIQVGDYIVLPAIKDKKLSKVEIVGSTTKYFTTLDLKAVTADTDETKNPTFGAVLVSDDNTNSTHVWDLKGKSVTAGARYALVANAANATNGLRIVSLTLYYN